MQAPRQPDLPAQRAAMKKLAFLIGSWEGEARVLRGPGAMVDLVQTEFVEYKLDGLILAVEGIGKTKDGRAALQAYGIVSFDDENGTYHMRAFNDGRFLETEVKLLEEGSGSTWGFTLGDFKTNSVMRINDKGEWTELTELIIGSQPPVKLIELAVRGVSRTITNKSSPESSGESLAGEHRARAEEPQPAAGPGLRRRPLLRLCRVGRNPSCT